MMSRFVQTDHLVTLCTDKIA